MFDLMPFDYRNGSIDKFFGDMARSFFSEGGNSFSSFRTDILDKGDKFVLQAELPGFQKEDIHIDINNDVLTVSAEHKEEKEEKQDGYIRRERTFGSFARSFDISGVQTDSIAARYENGILELDLPKVQSKLPEARKIEIQ